MNRAFLDRLDVQYVRYLFVKNLMLNHKNQTKTKSIPLKAKFHNLLLLNIFSTDNLAIVHNSPKLPVRWERFHPRSLDLCSVHTSLPHWIDCQALQPKQSRESLQTRATVIGTSLSPDKNVNIGQSGKTPNKLQWQCFYVQWFIQYLCMAINTCLRSGKIVITANKLTS